MKLWRALKNLLWDFHDEFTGARYGVTLQLDEGEIVLLAYRGKRWVPFKQVASICPPLAELRANLPGAKNDAIPVPLGMLTAVKELLQRPEIGEVVEVHIAPEVEKLRCLRASADFRVRYVWSSESGCILPRIAHGARYSGGGWFLSDDAYWHVESIRPEDEPWLRCETITGQDLIRLISEQAPAWQKSGAPLQCDVRTRSQPALALSLKAVGEELLAFDLTWYVSPERLAAVPSLPGHVFSDNLIMPGVAPAQLPEAFPRANGTFSITGQDIPAFLQHTWPILLPFARGSTEEIQKRHKVLADVAELVLTLHREIVDGIGMLSAVPAIAICGYHYRAEPLARKLAEGKLFVRVPRGWIPAVALEKAGLSPAGRARGGHPLDPVVLTPREILQLGSDRLAGPWVRFEAPAPRLPDGGEPAEIAAHHLRFLVEYGIPGGIIASAAETAAALTPVLTAFFTANAQGAVLVIGNKAALDAADKACGRLGNVRFDGRKNDPTFNPSRPGIVLATPGALSESNGLLARKWTLVVMLDADELVKSGSSKLYANLVSCNRTLVIGGFTEDGFIQRKSRREALASVFKIDEGDFLWQYCLRDPRHGAPSLPPPYVLDRPSKQAHTGPAEITIRAAKETARAIPIPPRAASMPRTPTVASVKVWVGYGRDAEEFVRQARLEVSRTESTARFVPFQCYWPTYDSMAADQRRWYFYWRSEVRRGAYPDTDLSYIFVHVYELLNNIGVKDARDGYEQMRRVWLAYRQRYPKLDAYLVDWMADYLLVNGTSVDPLHVYEEASGVGAYECDPDVQLAHLLKGSLSRLPIELIDLLTDYRIRRSKFYTGGNGPLMDEYLPKVIESVDTFMRKRNGRGIFEQYSPRRSETLRRTPFSSALYAGGVGEVTVANVMPYCQHPPLREFLTAVVKHAENRLREMKGFAGRLRGYELAGETVAFIDEFFGRARSRVAPPPPKQKVVIDLTAVRQLARESAEVRDMLLASGSQTDVPAKQAVVAETGTVEPQKGAAAEGLLTSVEPVRRMLGQLTSDEKRLLGVLRDSRWEAEDQTLVTAMSGVLVEPLVDRINALSIEVLGDFLIATEKGHRLVTDDHRDAIAYLAATLAQEQAHDGQRRNLPDEWSALRLRLQQAHVLALKAMCQLGDPRQELTRIAAGSGVMPSVLVDQINEAAMAAVGDVIIAPGSDPPVIEDEDREMVHRLVEVA